MRTRVLVYACIGIALVVSATCQAAETGAARLEGTITLSGAWALYPMAVRWAEEFTKIYPDVHLDIGAGGAGKGMADALAGAVDLGMVSRYIYEAEIERGAWWVSVTRDAVVPVVNAGNPVIDSLVESGLPRDALMGLWLDDSPGTWGALVEGGPGAPVRVYTRSDACGAAQTWASFLGGTQEDLHGVGVYGDPGLADAVRRDELGIGFNNINYVYDASTKLPVEGLTVLPIDIDGDGALGDEEDFYGDRDLIAEAIADGSYPSPPARDLHLVSRGRPESGLVREFLGWVLTEGQAYVDEAGYVELPAEKLKEERAKLAGK